MTWHLAWLEHPLADAIGWTLLHFLWQGALIAIATTGLLALLRARTAELRYVTACGAFVLMSSLPFATMAWCWTETSPSRRARASELVAPASKEPSLVRDTIPGTVGRRPAERPSAATPSAEAVEPGSLSLTTPEISYAAPWQARMRSIVPWLVCGWLSGVTLLSLRLLVIWAFVQRLRRVGTTPPDEAVMTLYTRLSARLRVSRPVQLLLSTLVEVPTVIGWLSPVILLPAGALVGLTPVQLEALLVHELTHIRRWDYLVNLLQNIVETLLFYHPGVWWLSSRIRQERENCCDDQAVLVCGDGVSYADALVRMEQLRTAAGHVALAAHGGHLLQRVRRILGNPERDRFHSIWQSGVVSLLVAAGLAAGLWRITQASADKRPTQQLANDAELTIADAASQPADVSTRSDNETVGNDTVLPDEDKGAPAAGELSARRIVAAIEKARQALLSSQQPSGLWRSNYDLGTHEVGITSLALLALLNSGMTSADPSIERGLNWLRMQDPTLTYEFSLMIQALAAVKDGKRDFTRVAELAAKLEDRQIRNGVNAGSWTYTRGGGGDRSNAQFAVLGLHEAQEMGVPVSLETWKRARDHWLATQNDDGSWSYSGGKQPAGGSGSMTAAGIASLVMTQAVTRTADNELNADGTPNCCGDPAVDKPLEDASRWMGDHFAVTNNPGDGRWLLYYLYGLERAGRLSGQRFFISTQNQKHDWYREGAEYLVSMQNQFSGTWKEGDANAVIGTSFALIFLSKGQAPVLIKKLQFGPRDANRAGIASIDWNRHPDDVRNLTQFISNRPKWPKLLTWQTVDVSQATVADLLRAPIVFISGSDVPQFTPEDVALLKEYTGKGGFIFVNNIKCKGAGFDRGFRDLVSLMFPPPEAQFTKLGPEHPVFRSEWNLIDPETGNPIIELWGVDVGGRTRIIYSPSDLACLWDKWTSFKVPGREQKLVVMIDNAMRTGVNIVAYATGRQFQNKLDQSR